MPSAKDPMRSRSIADNLPTMPQKGTLLQEAILAQTSRGVTIIKRFHGGAKNKK